PLKNLVQGARASNDSVQSFSSSLILMLRCRAGCLHQYPDAEVLTRRTWPDLASGLDGPAHSGASLFGCEHPFDAGTFRIAAFLPSSGLDDEQCVAVDAPIETLASQEADLDHVGPTAMLGDVVELRSAQPRLSLRSSPMVTVKA